MSNKIDGKPGTPARRQFAARVTARLVSALALSAAAMCGCAGGGGATDDAQGSLENALLTGQCISESTNAGQCEDRTVLEKKAAQSCLNKGLEMNKFEVSNACIASGFSSAKWICCKPTPQPPVPPCPAGPVPGPNPLPTACFAVSEGGAASCAPSAVLLNDAAAACKVKGLWLVSFSISGSCGMDLFRYSKYECCGQVCQPPPPPPPTPVCFSGVVGDKLTCKDDAVLKQEAFELCKTKAATLVAINYSDACPSLTPSPGVSRHTVADFKCCP